MFRRLCLLSSEVIIVAVRRIKGGTVNMFDSFVQMMKWFVHSRRLMILSWGCGADPLWDCCSNISWIQTSFSLSFCSLSIPFPLLFRPHCLLRTHTRTCTHACMHSHKHTRIHLLHDLLRLFRKSDHDSWRYLRSKESLHWCLYSVPKKAYTDVSKFQRKPTLMSLLCSKESLHWCLYSVPKKAYTDVSKFQRKPTLMFLSFKESLHWCF